MKVSKNFTLQEFVPQEVWLDYGSGSIRFLDSRLFELAQMFRDIYEKPITINDWMSGGSFNFSGFRPPDCTIGAPLSAHKMGRAIDIKIRGVSSADVIKNIIDNEVLYFNAGLKAIELGTDGWVHLSVENFNMNRIFKFEMK